MSFHHLPEPVELHWHELGVVTVSPSRFDDWYDVINWSVNPDRGYAIERSEPASGLDHAREVANSICNLFCEDSHE